MGTWLAFIAAGIYAFVAVQQKKVMEKTLCEVRKRSKAAQDTADTATRALIVSQRPWVDIQMNFDKPAYATALGNNPGFSVNPDHSATLTVYFTTKISAAPLHRISALALKPIRLPS